MGDSNNEPILERLRGQDVLTAFQPRRAALASLIFDEPIVLEGTVAVWRNHAVEPLEPLLHPYLSAGGLRLELVTGGYDDSLSCPPHPGSLLDLVWFDLDRVTLSEQELLEWFTAQVSRIAAGSKGLVVVVPVSDRPAVTAAVVSRIEGIPGIRCADPWLICAEAGVDLIDERMASLAGTRISRDAQIHLARALGTWWLPAALLPARKMVAVDLDGTLHSGVLGEDGIDGVVITPAHLRLHAHLKTLAGEGVLLALISRNEPEDVEQLLRVRGAEYGFDLKDFAAIEVSWGSKADAVRRAAAIARIDESAVVFVDDNPGEILAVALGCNGVALVRAHEDADRTIAALRWQTGLWRWKKDEAADVRAADLAANTHRERLLHGSGDLDRYLEELGVQAQIAIDCVEHVPRLAELSGKTNQFNLTVARLSEVELHRVIADPHRHVISVRLADRLSDSGVIALVVVALDGDVLNVQELAMSCRAMGRGLESLLISQALRSLPEWAAVNEVEFAVHETERNLPARRWVAGFGGLVSETAQSGVLSFPAEKVNQITVPESVLIDLLE